MHTPKLMPALEVLEAFYKIDPESPSGLSRIKTTQGPNGAVGPVLSVGTDGYWRMKFQNEFYRTNRVVYFMHHRKDPGVLFVDHIDGDPLNNLVANLRLCTHQQNLLNAKGKPKRSGLPKGIKAVSNGRYEVSLSVDGKRHVAVLANFNAATCYLKSLRARHHGEFARA
ncbi:HNH endonuclease [Pseudomonas extremorientalis]